eukprot:CAMPEP_0202471010 /NCGR_PEP_ID=MMETSP1360-20130828/83298_1 /ASSEMBLY_ACC=CAM_ASM_000848 /TAXON_ID=515479 /ORGANISM="Licmophora paradoxa, Strain CCMP2313" /LENGTH=40 /DNA_ID= /DNA_START= /DNA_END= /DNA_ORIENTATION=
MTRFFGTLEEVIQDLIRNSLALASTLFGVLRPSLSKDEIA